MSFGDYSTINMMDLQSELQLQEMLKAFKASQEMQDMLRKVSSNPIQLDDPKHAKISGNNPDPNIASSFVKGADVHHPSESSQLESFLDDLEVYASLSGD